jgi:hypothetical protein
MTASTSNRIHALQEEEEDDGFTLKNLCQFSLGLPILANSSDSSININRGLNLVQSKHNNLDSLFIYIQLDIGDGDGTSLHKHMCPKKNKILKRKPVCLSHTLGDKKLSPSTTKLAAHSITSVIPSGVLSQ